MRESRASRSQLRRVGRRRYLALVASNVTAMLAGFAVGGPGSLVLVLVRRGLDDDRARPEQSSEGSTDG